MAAMSLGFIVMVTPWTIQEVVAACTGSKPPPFLDFLATWLALSNSFWNPFLYWLLNNHFRRISKELLQTKVKIYVIAFSILFFNFVTSFSSLNKLKNCEQFYNKLTDKIMEPRRIKSLEILLIYKTIILIVTFLWD